MKNKTLWLFIVSVLAMGFSVSGSRFASGEPPYFITGEVKTPEGDPLFGISVGFAYVGHPSLPGFASVCQTGTNGHYGSSGYSQQGYLPFMPGQYDIRIVPFKEGYEFSPTNYLYPRASQSWVDIVRNFQGIAAATYTSGRPGFGTVDIGKMRYGYIDIPAGVTEWQIVYNIIGNAVILPSFNIWPTPPGGSLRANLTKVEASGTTQVLVINATSNPPLQPGRWYLGVYGNAPSTYSLQTFLETASPRPKISGTVYANNGTTPLAGVTVGGTDGIEGAVTDGQGKFSVTVPHFWCGELQVIQGSGRFAPYPLAFSMVNSNITTATFKGPLYELRITSEKGEVQGAGWYAANTTANWSIVNNEPAEAGTRFVPSQAGGAILMDGPKAIQVDWVTQYRLQTWAMPSGAGTLSPSTCWVLANSEAIFTPSPAAGWGFQGFEGDLQGSLYPRNLKINGPKKVIARFSGGTIPTPVPGILRVPSQYLTIQAAIDVAATGNQIIVDPGLYRETIQFRGKNVRVRSTDPANPMVVERTIIDGTTTTLVSVVTFRGDETSSCSLEGFTITGGVSYYGAGIMGNPDFESIEGTRAAIRHCVVTGNRAYYKSTYPEAGGLCAGIMNCDGPIEDCIVTDNITESWGGALHDCDGEILRCTVARNNYTGILQCDGTIAFCEVFGNHNKTGYAAHGIAECNGVIDSTRVHDQPNGIGISGCYNAVIQNCVVYGNVGNQAAGIAWNNNKVIHCTVYNNTNTASSSNGVGAGLNGCTGIVRNNIVWSNKGSTYPGWPAWNKQIWTSVYWDFKAQHCCIQDIDTTESYNLYVDPQFVDRAGGNLRLLSTSHCIDAGTSAGLTRDIAGVSRPQEGWASPRGDGSDFDMGAYEYAELAAPAKPVLKALPPVTAGDSILIAWAKAPNAAAYDLQCSADAGFQSIIEDRKSMVADGATTLTELFSALGDATYWYRVRGIGASGNSGSWSGAVFSRQDSSVPFFTNLIADPSTAQTNQTVEIRFQASETLVQAPLVQVNGRTARYLGVDGLAYRYSHRFAADEKRGAAALAITGTDLVGFVGSAVRTDVLTNVSPTGAKDWGSYR